MDLPDPGLELGSPALEEDSLPTELPGKTLHYLLGELFFIVEDKYRDRGIKYISFVRFLSFFLIF